VRNSLDGMKVIVVGGGPAGITAAIHARRLGAEVVLLERARLGGVCYNEGPVPVRTLARAARMVRDAGSWAEFGLVGAAPRVDVRAALANARRAVQTLYERKHAADQLRAEGIEVAEGTGPVRFVDERTLAVPDGTMITGDRSHSRHRWPRSSQAIGLAARQLAGELSLLPSADAHDSVELENLTTAPPNAHVT
jgi:pyruvate/2-oxoglutarate dehydrogenase complex dihydrolipoamide dehydrogenase (E3) component